MNTASQSVAMNQSELDDYQDSGCIDHTDPDVLKQLYWEQEMSLNDIANRSNVKHGTTILKWMDRYDIPRRDQADATRQSVQVPYAVYDMGPNGYMRWRSSFNSDVDWVMAHRLLAVAEYGFDSVKGKEVHHINGIPWHNSPNNITILDPKTHRKEHNTGEKSHFSKLTTEEVREIKNGLNKGKSQYELAEEYDVDRTTIGTIDREESWEHIDPDEFDE